MTNIGSLMKSLPADSLNLKGKKVLVTCCWLSGWGGGEINILQMVQQLKKFGADVECFTYWFNGPMVGAFDKLGVKVMSDSFNYLDTEDSLKVTDISISDYDYIWVCQQVLPVSIIRQLRGVKKLPRFIFLHMSALIGIPVEAPIVWDFEKVIYDKILAISEDTSQHIKRILGADFEDVSYYRNPAPAEYSRVESRSGRLRKIAVISNHPPEELMGLEGIIDGEVTIDYIGSWSGNYTLVDHNKLSEYDLIVGIGKNVQYCLVSGVPIYLYDHFGGCGYLNEDNFKLARENNFSGRGFGKKDRSIIAEEIIKGYSDSSRFHTINRQRFISEYSLDSVMVDVFSDIEPAKKVNDTNFSREYINYLISMQIMLHDRYVAWGGGRVVEKELNEARQGIKERDEYIYLIKKSNSYRLGNALLKPLSYVKKITKT